MASPPEPPDPRSRSGVHRGVDGAAGDRGREVRTDSGAESELQPARGAFRENDQDRVRGTLCHFRRAAPAAPAQGVHGALSDRAPPPRDRQPDHQSEGIAKQRQRDARHDCMPVASRRTAQLLLPGGRMTHAATAFRTTRASSALRKQLADLAPPAAKRGARGHFDSGPALWFGELVARARPC
jgi:hypothetical protein